MIIGDFHTHTVFSHGKGSIEDNVAAAHEKGLKAVAITDHGLRHVVFGMKRKDVPEMQRQIDAAQEKYPDVRVLFGIEANIFSSDGDVDLKPEDVAHFDVILAGYHKAALPKNPAEVFRFYASPMIHNKTGYPKRTIDRFTKAYINAIKSGKVDVITHLNYGVKTDVRQVAQAAKDYGVLLELNGKRVNLSDEEILTIADVGAKMIVNSDAHTSDRVGDFSVPMEFVERLNIDKRLIVNWDDLPNFDRRGRFGKK